MEDLTERTTEELEGWLTGLWCETFTLSKWLMTRDQGLRYEAAMLEIEQIEAELARREAPDG